MSLLSCVFNPNILVLITNYETVIGTRDRRYKKYKGEKKSTKNMNKRYYKVNMDFQSRLTKKESLKWRGNGNPKKKPWIILCPINSLNLSKLSCNSSIETINAFIGAFFQEERENKTSAILNCSNLDSMTYGLNDSVKHTGSLNFERSPL